LFSLEKNHYCRAPLKDIIGRGKRAAFVGKENGPKIRSAAGPGKKSERLDLFAEKGGQGDRGRKESAAERDRYKGGRRWKPKRPKSTGHSTRCGGGKIKMTLG